MNIFSNNGQISLEKKSHFRWKIDMGKREKKTQSLCQWRTLFKLVKRQFGVHAGESFNCKCVEL